MPRLRLLFTWLLLAVLPLQGFAAASMLPCGPMQQAAAWTAPMDSAHDHGPSHAHPGSSHGHHAGQGHAPSSSGADLADEGHSCSACAAACHAVALTGETAQVAIASSPAAPLSQAVARFDSRRPPVPDKPPSA